MSERDLPKAVRPYDETDIDSILRYAARLTDRTLREIISAGPGIVGDVSSKGRFGQVVEEGYFLIENNNDPYPDFDQVGLELKVTPMKEIRKGLVSKERLVLSIINYDDVPVRGFDIFLHKSAHILMVFYLWKDRTDIYDYRVLKVVDWIPTAEEMRLIREDWDVIQGYVMRGEAHLLSERHTRILAACTKGAGHDRDMRTQPFSDVSAKQRALSFKSSFMTELYHSHVDINESLGDGVSGGDSVFRGGWKEGVTFEEHVLGYFRGFEGLTCREIERRLGICLNDMNKQYYFTLILAMMGITKSRRVREFDESGIRIKTVRIRKDGTPKESMSFPAFKFEEIAVQTWETSDLYGQLDHGFFIPVFQFRTDRPADEGRKDLVFRGAFFWSIPDRDFVTIEGVWTDTRSKVLEERFDDFIKASDGRISHVRPHGRNSADTYPFRGKEHTKMCFWLNSDYIKRVVRENLGRRSSPKDGRQ